MQRALKRRKRNESKEIITKWREDSYNLRGKGLSEVSFIHCYMQISFIAHHSKHFQTQFSLLSLPFATKTILIVLCVLFFNFHALFWFLSHANSNYHHSFRKIFLFSFLEILTLSSHNQCMCIPFWHNDKPLPSIFLIFHFPQIMSTPKLFLSLNKSNFRVQTNKLSLCLI